MRVGGNGRRRIRLVGVTTVLAMVTLTAGVGPEVPVGPVPALAATAGSAPGPVSSDELPDGALAAVSRALGRDDPAYHATATSSGASLVNTRNELSARFARDGATAVTVGAARWTLRLSGWGYGDELAVPGPVRQVGVYANAVRYRRDALTEWYVNGPAGLQQGFTLAAAPPGRANGPVTVAVAMGGNVTVRVTADADGLSAVTADGAAMEYQQLLVTDASGRRLPAWLELTERRTMLIRVIVDADARYPVTVDPLIRQAKLTASDADIGDQLGTSIAIDGDTLVAGSPGDDGEKGAAFVYQRPAGGEWADARQVAKLTADDGADQDRLGSSVAIDGGTIVVGSPYHTDLAESAGAAYVFVEPAGGWGNATQDAKLTGADAVTFDHLGTSVAIEAGTIVAGAPDRDESGWGGAGAVYVFTRSGEEWPSTANEAAKLTSGSFYGVDRDHLGSSVAIDGGTVVAGAPDAADGVGAAYVFTSPSGGGWSDTTESAVLLSAEPQPEADDVDHFGASVAIDGDTIAVGAPQGEPSASGTVYVFVRADGEWVGRTRHFVADAEGPARMGTSVAVEGDTIVAGAPGSASGAGAAFVFERPPGGWQEDSAASAELTSSARRTYDQLGAAVAVNGDSVVVGMPLGGNRCTGECLLAEGTWLAFAEPDAGWTDARQAATFAAVDPDPGNRLGTSVAVDGETIVAGAPLEDGSLVNADSGSVYVFTKPDTGWANATQTAKLTAADQENGARLGASVAIDGDTVVAGAPGADAGRGTVYVFGKPAGGWSDATESARLTGPDTEGVAPDGMAGHSVAIDGDTVVAGAPAAGEGAGAVYVFVRPATGWATADAVTAQLVMAGDGGGGTAVGRSVAISGDTVVAGAPDAGTGGGSALVFVRPPDGWAAVDLPKATLTGSDAGDDVLFGASVGVDGDTVAVGAPWDGGFVVDGGFGVDGGVEALPAGSVYVYVEPAGGWRGSALSETAKLTAADPASSNSLGASVAVDAEVILAGAPDVTGAQEAIYLYTRPVSGWTDATETQRRVTPGGDARRFGAAVAVDATTGTAVAGAPADDDSALDQGAAHVLGFPPRGAATFGVTPGTVSFGTVLPYAPPVVRTVAVVNTGRTPASAPAVSVRSEPYSMPGEYVVVRNGCRSASLAPGASCAVDVAYSPRQVGPRRATLVLTSSTGTTDEVTLTGRSDQQVVLVNPGVCRPGCVVSVTGTGFPPSRSLRLGLGPHAAFSRSDLMTTSDAAGRFTTSMVVFRGTGVGNIQLFVAALGTPIVASTNLLVSRGTFGPPDFLSRR